MNPIPSTAPYSKTWSQVWLVGVAYSNGSPNEFETMLARRWLTISASAASKSGS